MARETFMSAERKALRAVLGLALCKFGLHLARKS